MGKFAPTDQRVEEVIDSLKTQNKRIDAWKLVELCQSISKLEPVVWYPGIIGFGNYHYKYESGVEGDAPFLAFAPRQAKISLYIDQDLPERDDMLSRLGKHKPAVGCVYVNKLDDIDYSVLEEIYGKLFQYIKTKNSRWECDKCGRQFVKQHQAHSCVKAASVDHYLMEQEPSQQASILEFREVLLQALPDVEERIAWGMPTYWKGKNILHFSVSKKHITLHPGKEALEVFSEELAPYQQGKASVQFPFGQEWPKELLAKMASWCLKKYGK